MSASETSSLLPKANGEQKKFYFLNASPTSSQQKAKQQVASIPISDENSVTTENPQSPTFLTWISSIFQRPSRQGYTVIGNGSSGNNNNNNGNNQMKPRMVPVKVEPKVFFANERTFLAWLHMSVTLASISIAIVA